MADQTQQDQEEQTYFNLNEVLLKELDAILPERPDEAKDETLKVKEAADREILRRRVQDRGQSEMPDSKVGTAEWKNEQDKNFQDVAKTLNHSNLTALCLSGGGIRSATFNLGILQALAKCGLLKEIDYLSTVSGGGYIGSWLSSWIQREVDGAKSESAETLTLEQEKSAVQRGKAAVFDALAQKEDDLFCKEPYQIRFLRDYSNYLTPRVGFLSIDTWAIIGTYLRNLLLNWLVLLPLFFTVLLLPRWLTALLMVPSPILKMEWVYLALGALLGIIAIAYTAVDLPSVGNRRHSKGKFVLWFLLPVVLMAGSLSAYFASTFGVLPAGFPALKSFVCFATGVHVVGWLAGFATLRYSRGYGPAGGRQSFWWFGGCAALTGAVAGLLGWLAVAHVAVPLLFLTPHPGLLYLVLCVPVVLLVFLLTGALLVAVLSWFTAEPDREWWGRSGGMVLLAALSWSLFLAIVFYGPWLIVNASFWKWIWTAVGGASGIAAALIGKAPSTPATHPGARMTVLRTNLPALLSGIFIAFLAVALSLLASQWLPVLPQWPPPAGFQLRPLDPYAYHTFVVLNAPVGTVAVLTGGSLLLCLIMALVVNINKFSLHAMYRNRLVRCYLGASRPEDKRKPNPFTGFDPKDDLYMKSLPKRPFHVVNAAWNLVKGRRLAWQQRKAASFFFTPLVAGGDVDIPLKLDHEPAKRQPGGFRIIGEYGGGIEQPMLVGTAMAISGAAASPNMGYHSSPLVTFIMALFDVRLGWWLGNPGKGMRESWKKKSPNLALLHLLKETFGLTTEDSPYIYLSDGGHFENLGLYEMVRRRCRHIVVCDAGCDCDGTFEDLGNAIRKVRADFGIEIDIKVHAIRAKQAHFAVGTIRYKDCDGEGSEDGCLLYIKPVLTDDEPVDDFNYWKTHPGFPHETTADQWFDEAQFESYRRLGVHSLEPLIEGNDVSIATFFGRATRLHHQALRKALKAEKGAKELLDNLSCQQK